MSQQTQRKITTLPDHNHHGKKIWCKKSFFGNPVFNKTRQLFLDPSTHFALNFVEIPLISISCSDWKKPTPSLHFPLMQIWKFNMESFPFQFKFIKYDVSVRRSDGNFQFIIPNCEYSLCFKFHLPLADSKIDEIPPNFFFQISIWKQKHNFCLMMFGRLDFIENGAYEKTIFYLSVGNKWW